MKRLRCENGAALMLVLLLTVVAMIAAAAMLYMVARGGNIFGQQKRYKSAVQAAKGGAELSFQVIGERGLIPSPGRWIGPNLTAKLTTGTSGWGSTFDNSVTIVPGNDNTYDMSFDLGDYRVYSKIVDTVVGNTGANLGLLNSGVVNTGSGEVVVVSMPFLYTIEELAESPTNPSERVKYTILYQY
ncbi:MAG TPA: hypothetical protein VIU29_10910 [Candidatus Deferrimicrobiaceae bacterium]